jgi:hypothetical protein
MNDHMCQLGHGYTVVWTRFGEGRSTFHACGFSTPEEADKSRAESLRGYGWEPPKWWQWWRWDDTRPTR